MIKRISVLIMMLGFASNTFAVDQAAKEEITPPPAEGALTVEQITPISGEKPAAPTAKPATPVNNLPAATPSAAPQQAAPVQ